ncbi:MAG: hypothetical protein H0U70_00930 [Tatlockia sp.]|nr:hypothetical protein [Tatlockia sp.]
MYNYYKHDTKQGPIYYKIGFDAEGKFEFYDSEDNQHWNNIEVFKKNYVYELKAKHANDKIAFGYSEDAKYLALICSTNINSSSVQVQQLNLQKIAASSLPFSLQPKPEVKVPSKGDILTPVPAAPACFDVNMETVGFFVECVGFTAIALAFIFLSGASLGIVAGLGAAAMLVGFGLFAAGMCKNERECPTTPFIPGYDSLSAF